MREISGLVLVKRRGFPQLNQLPAFRNGAAERRVGDMQQGIVLPRRVEQGVHPGWNAPKRHHAKPVPVLELIG